MPAAPADIQQPAPGQPVGDTGPRPAAKASSYAASVTRVLLVSAYEQGHQPLGLASPAAALRAAGHDVRTLDIAVQTAAPEHFDGLDLIAISVPMHTASRIALRLAAQLRDRSLHAPIVLYGLYASALAAHLPDDSPVSATIGGEYEGPLVAMADALANGAPLTVPGTGPQPLFPRAAMPLPDRHGLPPLDEYARALVLTPQGAPQERLAGYVEATRGCAHRCTHCPLTPTYAGRLRLVPPEIILADIDAQVAMGARHISFGDPDFFNALPHAMSLLRDIAQRHPGLSLDVTIKVEHLLEHPQEARALPGLGVAWVTSAFESVDDALLARLDKGHTVADMERALALARDARLPLRPTWLPFTPWTTRHDFHAILNFIARHDLIQSVPPVQYALRLLLPPGSPLIAQARAEGHLTGFDEDGLTYTWRNPDPAVDALQAKIAAFVGRLACRHDQPTDNARVFTRIRSDAALAAGLPLPRPESPPAGWVPGLSEAWFC